MFHTSKLLVFWFASIESNTTDDTCRTGADHYIVWFSIYGFELYIFIMKCESHSCFICIHYYCVTDLKSYTYMTSFYYENVQQCTYDIWSWSYDGWISNYLYKQCLSPLTSWIRIPLKRNHLLVICVVFCLSLFCVLCSMLAVSGLSILDCPFCFSINLFSFFQ
jgi:hypothetical protein